jgi:hypothetical protein
MPGGAVISVGAAEDAALAADSNGVCGTRVADGAALRVLA